MTAPRILMVAAVQEELAPFVAGSNGGFDLLFTGMGGPHAFHRVRRRLAQNSYELIVSTGFAGGTRPGFHVGDLVWASEVIEQASGRRWVPASSFWNSSGNFVRGPFVTSRGAVATPEGKVQLGNRYGAVAVDMETAAVAEAAHRAGVPWVGVRAILDPMERTLPVASWQGAFWSLFDPTRWEGLFQLRRAVRTAGRSLADGLGEIVREISMGGEKNGSG